MKRRLIDRIQDRAWREVGGILATKPEIREDGGAAGREASVSGTMDWVELCSEFGEGRLGSRNFRRISGVRDVVETVGPVDGSFYAGRVRQWAPEWLQNSKVHEIDSWGQPIKWPGFLLGAGRSFSPTTLRYLATALWLKKEGYVTQGSEIIEIGVGFGGLAAMNGLISDVVTHLVDLPPVERAAMRMLDEHELGKFGRHSSDQEISSDAAIISNYAFTELNKAAQEEYFERYIRKSKHGAIVSNSDIFASSIQGRTNDELLEWFQKGGLPARIERTNDLLGPGDDLCRVCMIRW
ncbi:hypothetical protein [Haloferula sp.]|uniref:hypothetical protein n=1 Tax=Haloferula sp. TaxID=2497595 RepID=UPI00329FC026